MVSSNTDRCPFSNFIVRLEITTLARSNVIRRIIEARVGRTGDFTPPIADPFPDEPIDITALTLQAPPEGKTGCR